VSHLQLPQFLAPVTGSQFWGTWHTDGPPDLPGLELFTRSGRSAVAMECASSFTCASGARSVLVMPLEGLHHRLGTSNHIALTGDRRIGTGPRRIRPWSVGWHAGDHKQIIRLAGMANARFDGELWADQACIERVLTVTVGVTRNAASRRRMVRC